VDNSIRVGTAEVDITPPHLGFDVGWLAGGHLPRKAQGVRDPLLCKAIVFDSDRGRCAFVVCDLLVLAAKTVDESLRRAAAKTPLKPDEIMLVATHTHSGPYTAPVFGADDGHTDERYVAALPERIAQNIEAAWNGRRPARLSHASACVTRGVHYRRVRLKGGGQINTWLAGRKPLKAQMLGAAGPADYELGAIFAEDDAGKPMAALYDFTLHANARGGVQHSADYPAVVQACLREKLGSPIASVFLPGACGNINPTASPDDIGRILADSLAGMLASPERRPLKPPIASRKTPITVPLRDLANAHKEYRRTCVEWGHGGSTEVYEREYNFLVAEGAKDLTTPLQAVRIGDVGFGSVPGELFVEYGLKLKERSPFPFTYAVELANDYVGYLITQEAYEQGGYEACTLRSSKVTPAGARQMVDKVLEMLTGLWAS